MDWIKVKDKAPPLLRDIVFRSARDVFMGCYTMKSKSMTQHISPVFVDYRTKKARSGVVDWILLEDLITFGNTGIEFMKIHKVKKAEENVIEFPTIYEKSIKELIENFRALEKSNTGKGIESLSDFQFEANFDAKLYFKLREAIRNFNTPYKIIFTDEN